MTSRPSIGIDLGGTFIKAAIVDSNSGSVLRTVTRPTRDGEWREGVPEFAHGVLLCVEELEHAAGKKELAVGLSAPGLAADTGTAIRWMPGRMHGIEGFDWEHFLDRRVRVLNDAHAAMLGEVWVGAARSVKNAFMLTLGTGVGGAVYADGRLLKGHIGRAGHLGHISINADGAVDAFQTPGSLEQAMGNQTVRQRTGGRFETTHALVEAAIAGDSQAILWWGVSLRALAVAVASLVNVLDPEVVVIGGGIAIGAGDAIIVPLRREIARFEWQPGGCAVRVELAQAGDWAGAVGAVWNLLHS